MSLHGRRLDHWLPCFLGTCKKRVGCTYSWWSKYCMCIEFKGSFPRAWDFEGNQKVFLGHFPGWKIFTVSIHLKQPKQRKNDLKISVLTYDHRGALENHRTWLHIYIYRILEENLGAGFWDHAYKLMNELCKLMYVWATSIYCVRQYCWLIPYFEVWSWTMLQVWSLSCVLPSQIWQRNLDSTFSSLKLKCNNDRSTVLY